MIVCQNEDNPYQFTVIIENLSDEKPDGTDEIAAFDDANNGDAETTLYEAIIRGLEKRIQG